MVPMLGIIPGLNVFNSFLIFRVLIVQPLGSLSTYGVRKFIEKIKPQIKNQLKKQFKQNLKKALIKSLIIFLGVFITIFNFFGKTISLLVTSILFLFVLIWSFISIIKSIRQNYKLPIFIIKEKSFYEGTIDFLEYKWSDLFTESIQKENNFFKRTGLKILEKTGIKNLRKGYDNVKTIGGLFSKKFQELPELKSIFLDIVRYLTRDVIIFLVVFILYFLLMSFVKPILLGHFAGISTLEVYLFPFVQIKYAFLHLFM